MDDNNGRPKVYALQTDKQSHAKSFYRELPAYVVSYRELSPYELYITQTGHTGWLVMFLAEPSQSYVHVDQRIFLLAIRERTSKEIIPCKFASTAAAKAHYPLELPVVEEKVDRPYGPCL